MRVNGCGIATRGRGTAFICRSEAADAGGSFVTQHLHGVNAVLEAIGPDLKAIYSRIGRPSIAPEKPLRASLLQLFHGIRLEREMMERLDFYLSFRGFVRLGVDDRV